MCGALKLVCVLSDVGTILYGNLGTYIDSVYCTLSTYIPNGW